MRMRAEQLGPLHADGLVAERRAFGGTPDDSDVLGHPHMLQAVAPGPQRA